MGWYTPPCSSATAASASSSAVSCVETTSAHADAAGRVQASRTSACRREEHKMLCETSAGGVATAAGVDDGFADSEPCVFTSLKPAWADRNLFILAEKV